MSNERADRKESLFKIFLKSIAGVMPFFIPIAVFLAYLTGVKVDKIIAIEFFTALSVSAIWISILYKKTSKAAKSPSKFPKPTALWRFIINSVPTERGKEYGSDKATKILIIFDNGTKEIVDSIENKYKDGNIIIDRFNFSNEKETKEKEETKKKLLSAIDNCDALYMFWTDEIKESKSIYPLINDWALKNSHKPVLVVNMIPECTYDLTFNTIPKNEAESALWRLFARSNERSEMWRLQANLNRRVGIVLIFILLITNITTNLYFKFNYESKMTILESNVKKESSRGLENIGKIKANDFFDSLQKLHKISEFYENYLDQQKITRHELDFFRSALCSYTRIKLKNLFELQGISSIGSKLTFWKKGMDVKGKKYIYVAASSNDDKTRFDYDNGTIMGFAFINKNHFMLWKDENNFKNGEPASWNLEGDVSGKWCKNGGYIEFLSDKSRGYYKPQEKVKSDRQWESTGFICFATEDKYGNEYGVCLNTDSDPKCLTTDFTKYYLVNMISDIFLIPDDILDSIASEKPAK